jgi:group II intron reverse transcriptase/maturase
MTFYHYAALFMSSCSVTNTYRPMQARKKEIPKDGGKKVRVLSIPLIRDRVVQGALKLILEPIFEADFQEGSYGYRPKRTAHEAVARVARAIVEEKTRIIDLDLTAYFDSVQHSLRLEKVARRVHDDAVMHLLKMILKATGKKGVPQGGVISPLLSNLYLNEVDRMMPWTWPAGAFQIAGLIKPGVGADCPLKWAEPGFGVPTGIPARRSHLSQLGAH